MRIPRARRLRRRLRRALSPRPPHVARSQTDEAEILARLVEVLDAPRSFLEFGFHSVEFNCASLLRSCRGLLVDAEERNVAEARKVMPRNVRAVQLYVDLDNVERLAAHFKPGKLGVLSIDVDGNDYWFLEALLPTMKPAIAAVEYNASFGLRPVTVPYDARFDRHEKHPSGLYHGASLEALARLGRRHGYRLVAVSAGGNNAFFASSAEIDDLPTLDPATAYKEEAGRNELLGTSAAEQWDEIRALPFVEIE